MLGNCVKRGTRGGQMGICGQAEMYSITLNLQLLNQQFRPSLTALTIDKHIHYLILGYTRIFMCNVLILQRHRDVRDVLVHWLSHSINNWKQNLLCLFFKMKMEGKKGREKVPRITYASNVPWLILRPIDCSWLIRHIATNENKRRN